mmetsp:Transcript_42051/g.82472  ORF Transcript_42051/g.82472 Transcript_42051/m.82472 type:complete len:105 (+) Transcript_42051:595-909(+)
MLNLGVSKKNVTYSKYAGQVLRGATSSYPYGAVTCFRYNSFGTRNRAYRRIGSIHWDNILAVPVSYYVDDDLVQSGRVRVVRVRVISCVSCNNYCMALSTAPHL